MTLADKRQRGFTLLEVLLTLSVAVALMALVGGALRFYATDLNIRDMDVRQAQLAASILQMISDDLRASIHPQQFDAQPLEDFLATAAGNGSGELSAAAEAVLGLDDPLDPTIDDGAGESLDLVSATMVLQRPGLIGNQTELQFDISRLPRLEQWRPLMTGGGEVTDIPSDLKTVTYYLQPAGMSGGVSDPLAAYLPAEADTTGLPVARGDSGAAPGGLVRRQLDRAANLWAMQTGALSTLLGTGDLLASEVVALEFSYFDGAMWQVFWNSDQMGSLPLAIQVKLTLASPAGQPQQPQASDSAPTNTRTFTQIIQLPAGRPAQAGTLGAGAF